MAKKDKKGKLIVETKKKTPPKQSKKAATSKPKKAKHVEVLKTTRKGSAADLSKKRKAPVRAEIVKPDETDTKQLRAGLIIFGLLIVIIGSLSFYILAQTDEVNQQYRKFNDLENSN